MSPATDPGTRSMHWIALVESPDHVCCRYRLVAFRSLLANAGYSLELRRLPRSWWARLREFRGLRSANVILQRRLLPLWQLAYLRRCVHRLIFDLDDAMFLRDSYSPRGLHDPGRSRRFAAIVRACDAVIAGNSFLAARALTHTTQPRVHVIPTCVDPGLYPLAATGQSRGVVQLVWIGSSSTLQGLERCTSLLEALGSRIPELRLKLICDRALPLRNLATDFHPWSEVSEATELSSADIGMSLVPDDDWSRGKCGLKVLQYMAAGLPVVANPVGVHVEMVRHNETGFLAATTDEWISAVGQLAADPALRWRMGRAGRRLVEERYSVTFGASHWQAVLDGLSVNVARTA
jgi:glycosyltransferase involved in cell wall biosynthesis